MLYTEECNSTVKLASNEEKITVECGAKKCSVRAQHYSQHEIRRLYFTQVFT